MKNNKIILILGLLIAGSLFRFAPKMPNVAPMVALTLFGASLLKKNYLGLILPLVFLYISDFILNNTIARPFFTQEGTIWFSTYMIFGLVAYAIIYLLGRSRINPENYFSLAGISIVSSFIFFVVTNIGSVYGPLSTYQKNFSGMIDSLIAGLPFFQSSILSDLVMTLVIFGLYNIVSKQVFAEGRQVV